MREQGYIEPGEVHSLLTGSFGVGSSGSDADEAWLRVVRRMVAARLGTDAADAPDQLAFLSSSKSAAESWKRYIMSPAPREVLGRWQRTGANTSGETEPEPHEVVGDILLTALSLGGFTLNRDRVTVRLQCSTRPLATNGRWDPAESRLVWSFEVDESPVEKRRIPVVAHAQWTEPARDFQTEHFGREFLTGEPLEDYCAWRSGLAEADGRAWDDMLAALRPDGGVRGAIHAFVFPPGSTADPSPGIDLLLKALADGK